MLEIIFSFYTHICIYNIFFLSVVFCFGKQNPHRAYNFLNSMSSFSVDSTHFSHLLFVYGSYIQESKAWMAYAAASLSFQLNSAEEVGSKPEMFNFTCTNRRSPRAYLYASSAGALQTIPSPHLCALLAEGRTLIQTGFNPQGRTIVKSVWHQPTFPKSCSVAPSNVQPLLFYCQRSAHWHWLAWA